MPPKFRVEITRTAERDLRSIFEYITQESREAAVRWLAEIDRQIETLERFPKRCPVIPESEELGREYRHLILGHYRTLFRIEGKRVLILRVVHGAQLLKLEGL